MSLICREICVPADPLQLARRLEGQPGLSFLWGKGRGAASYLAVRPAQISSELDPDPALPLSRSAHAMGGVPRWIGIVPYECRRQDLEQQPGRSWSDGREAPHVSSPVWQRYGAVARIADRVHVVGDDAAAVSELVRLLSRPTPLDRPSASLRQRGRPEADAVHQARIEQALESIAAGELYQVNLARRLDFSLSGSQLSFLEDLSRRGDAAYGALLELPKLSVISNSPELLLSLGSDASLKTVPIKGTRPRGADAAADRALAEELERDPKERAELAMVVDVERNDLGRIAEIGSVRVVGKPQVSTHRAVHHRGCAISARLRKGVSRSELLRAMLPSGSVTGAPKRRAMERIAELEAARRGLYTGGIGYLGHDGGLTLSMAIRTCTVNNGEAHYFAGGGIVIDSDALAEVRETNWKALQLAALTNPEDRK